MGIFYKTQEISGGSTCGEDSGQNSIINLLKEKVERQYHVEQHLSKGYKKKESVSVWGKRKL